MEIRDIESETAALVNRERAAEGIPALTLSGGLTYIARRKSRDMWMNRELNHFSPTYGSPFDMLAMFGVSFTSAAENIAMGFQTPESVMDAWMNSQGHRSNMLNPVFTEIGVGYYSDPGDPRGGPYWTQLFVRR